MRILIVNSKQTYATKIAKLRENCAAKGLQLDLWEHEDKTSVVAHALTEGYDMLLHRNEHGRLFADRDVPNLQYGVFGWINEALAKGLPVLSTDFGYLDHYKTVSFDFYRHDLSSGIHDLWASLPEEVNWRKAPRYIRDYRSSVLEKIALADGSSYAGKVCVWMQWGAVLLRPELQTQTTLMPQYEWVNRVCAKIQSLGLEPVVKMGIVNHSDIHERTVPYIDRGIKLVTDKRGVAENNPRALLDPEANARLLAGCSYHVLLCSSVSHLMVLAQRPVIATGGSWFNRLGVFQEPTDWQPPFIRPKVDPIARAKWINWWLQNQCLWENAAETLLHVAAQAQAYHKLNKASSNETHNLCA